MPLERKINLVGRALEVIAEFSFPIHIITKSNLVLKDLETIKRINKVYATISFTITTTDDDLAAKVEPYAPRPSARLKAMRVLADNGIQTGVTMMPILPYIEDNEENISQIVEKAAVAGATYIIPWMGMTMRYRQRDYFFNQLDVHFPGVKKKYVQRYGGRYGCDVPDAKSLYRLCTELCERHGIKTKLPLYAPQAVEQLSLFY